MGQLLNIFPHFIQKKQVLNPSKIDVVGGDPDGSGYPPKKNSFGLTISHASFSEIFSWKIIILAVECPAVETFQDKPRQQFRVAGRKKRLEL